MPEMLLDWLQLAVDQLQDRQQRSEFLDGLTALLDARQQWRRSQ
jgi:hypothetical protein